MRVLTFGSGSRFSGFFSRFVNYLNSLHQREMRPDTWYRYYIFFDKINWDIYKTLKICPQKHCSNAQVQLNANKNIYIKFIKDHQLLYKVPRTLTGWLSVDVDFEQGNLTLNIIFIFSSKYGSCKLI